MSLEELNKDAQERFMILRRKMKLDVINISLEKENVPLKPINEKLLQKLLDNKQLQNQIDTETDFVSESFSFIESLNLSPQLSLAIGLIISHSKTDKPEEIAQAIQVLENYCVGRGKQ